MGEKGCYLAIYFPNDDPPGWAWGKPLTNTKRTAAHNFWVNFSVDEQPYDEDDDVKVELPSLNAPVYNKSWAVVAPKSLEVQAPPAPGDDAQVRIPRYHIATIAQLPHSYHIATT